MLFFLITPVFAQNPAQGARTLGLHETLGILGRSGAGEAEFRWDPLFASGTFSAGEHEAAFVSGGAGETGLVLLDRKEVLTLPLPYLERGDIRFPETFVTQVNNTFERYAEEDSSRFRIAAIVIDPGHGGRDPGTIGEHTIRGRTQRLDEKTVNLKVARQVYASLTAAFPDKKVLITREGDTFPSLEARVNLANSVPLADNEVAIYVSIHANASKSTDAKGYEVWYLSPGYRRQVLDNSRYTVSEDILPILNTMLEEALTTQSILMATYILKRLEEAAGTLTRNRGLKAEEWFVVRNARMPAVLVEMAFLSNEQDFLLMSDDAYLMKLSEALYKGICDFISFFERPGGFVAAR
jgi:N-acetylmuramoyl-L-alanine amidase